MTAMLVFIVVVLSIYFSISLTSNIKSDMRQHSQYIMEHFPTQKSYQDSVRTELINRLSNYTILIQPDDSYTPNKDKIISYQKNGQDFFELKQHYPNSNKYLTIIRNTTHEWDLITKSYLIILIMIILGILFILYFAKVLSQKLMHPLDLLTEKFTNMSESILQPIKTDELPLEFIKLGDAMNLLITKIQTFINYRKELYVGTAHELKTPLAVMRLKNQITLMKYKKEDKIRETLQQNISSIDTLNAMIHNILEYGRAEGAQFEKPQRVNLIRLMATKAEEYELLAQSQNRNFIYHFSVPDFRINLQILLFMQIFQNFIQNALKFTPVNGLVSLQTRMDEKNFIIEIIDEGPGIDESKDFFAPFQRSLESTGAGLGLFLAQNAAASMGVNISLNNRQNISGCIAKISFPLSMFLLKD